MPCRTVTRENMKVAAAVGDHDNLLAIKLDVTRPQGCGGGR